MGIYPILRFFLKRRSEMGIYLWIYAHSPLYRNYCDHVNRVITDNFSRLRTGKFPKVFRLRTGGTEIGFFFSNGGLSWGVPLCGAENSIASSLGKPWWFPIDRANGEIMNQRHRTAGNNAKDGSRWAGSIIWATFWDRDTVWKTRFKNLSTLENVSTFF